MTHRGIWKTGAKADKGGNIIPTVNLICSTRLMITGKYENADTGADVAELTFVNDDKVEIMLTPSVGTWL